MIILVIPFVYALVYTLWALMIVSVVVVYIGGCAIVFALALVCAAIREVFRTQRPRSPRRPSMPISQARFSSRR
jgi:hypothetical protein